MRHLLVLCLIAGLCVGAEEASATQATPADGLKAERFRYPFKDTEPLHFSDGMHLVYQGLLIEAESLEVLRSPYPGLTRPDLEKGDLLSGPKGPRAEGRPPFVVLDTRRSTDPKIGFRGRLEPRQVHLLRRPPDPKTPKLAVFSLRLLELGDIEGEVKVKEGWRRVSGWAERAEGLLAADVEASGFTRFRFIRLVFYGRPAVEAVPDKPEVKPVTRRFAILDTPLPPELEANVFRSQENREIPPEERGKPWRMEGSEIEVGFDAEGQLSYLTGSGSFGELRRTPQTGP